LLFVLLRPVECGAYSSGVNGKQKKRSLSVLCASAVNYYKSGGRMQDPRIPIGA